VGILGHHPSPSRSRRARVAAALASAAGLVVLAALPSACAARATEGSSSSAAARSSGASAVATPHAVKAGDPAGGGGTDWQHVLQVVANLRADPPAAPVVVLLGGSAARESTVSDADWAAQIAAAGGPAAAAFNLGSRNRTLAQDVALVKLLPHGPTVVYIGINVGRFTSPPSSPAIKLPQPTASAPPYDQHQYSQAKVKSAAQKKALVRAWLSDRYPYFKANYATSLRTLSKLVVACKERGFKPVLLELPRDTAIIGSSLDVPTARFTADCKKLAAAQKVPWVSFVARARLPDADFYDLWHLVEPGREVWQTLLSEQTARLLKQYGMGGAGQ
jgi:hypothetical protein